MTNKDIVKTIAKAYRYHKHIIYQDENIIETSYRQIQVSKKICNHIEYVISGLDDKYRVILENDVIKGLIDKKFKDGISQSTYYRNRDKAYELFIKELNN